MPRPCDQAHKVDRLKAAARRVQAFDLAKAGASYRQIGKALGVSQTQAQRDVVAVLDELNAMSRRHAEDLRRLQSERLRDLRRSLWPAAMQGDVSAVQTLLRIDEREAKLWGLDAPSKIDITGRIRIWAEQEGLDADAVVAEAERLVRLGQDL